MSQAMNVDHGIYQNQSGPDGHCATVPDSGEISTVTVALPSRQPREPSKAKENPSRLKKVAYYTGVAFLVKPSHRFNCFFSCTCERVLGATLKRPCVFSGFFLSVGLVRKPKGKPQVEEVLYKFAGVLNKFGVLYKFAGVLYKFAGSLYKFAGVQVCWSSQ